MPGIEGPQLVQFIRGCQRPGYVYVILLTAKSQTQDIVQGMKAGADDFLVKPFDRDELQVRFRAGERIVQLEHDLSRRNAELQAANERMRRDLEAAALAQRSLLPANLPNSSRARFAWAFRPCEEMSGDGIGILRLDERHTSLYVLDVSGHGVPAALLSVTVSRFLSPVFSASSLLRQPVPGAETWRIVPPAEVVTELNGRFPIDPESGRFFTVLYGILDEDCCQFRYVSAGHPGPVYVPADGEPVVLKSRGSLIGLPTSAFQEKVVHLQPGDRLYLYSDGICEAACPEGGLFGPTRLLDVIQESRRFSLQDSLEVLMQRVLQWRGTAQLGDDASLLAFEVTSGS